MPRKPKPGLAELREMALQHAQQTVKSVALLPTSIGEEDFGRYLKTIMQALINAWAAGYAEGAKR